jgi:hypothetical protein
LRIDAFKIARPSPIPDSYGKETEMVDTRHDDDQDFNPLLQAQFLQVVQNQLDENNPPETRQTYDRLRALGISDEDARIYIAQVVCVEVWDCLHNQSMFNLERFVRNLNRLPEEPEELSEEEDV